jgi:opacity protein-like surface antigen
MKYILLSALIVAYGLNGSAQTSFTMSYPISFPMGNLKDYTSAVSYRGFNMEFLHEAKPGVLAGVEVGWNVFYDRVDKKDYKATTATISGVQFRYTNSVPILAVAKYALTSGDKPASPYAGLGIGTLFTSRSTDFGLYRITIDEWQFCLRPEAGVLLHPRPGTSIMLGVKYYAAFNSNDLDGQSYLSANIGLLLSGM